MSPDERERRRGYSKAYKQRWAAISIPRPTYERIREAAKERGITQAQLIERACAEVGK